MLMIPQSTAKLVVFKAFLTASGAEATGKTIAITISKNGGSFGNPAAGATNATEISSGWYKVSLGTGDTDTLGPLAVRGAVSTIDDVGVWFEVVKATNAGLTALPDTACTTNASLLTSGTGTAQLSVSSGKALLQDNAVTAAVIASDAITDAKVASDVTIASVTGAVGSVTGITASDLGAIKSKTDNLPSDPADQSLIIAATDAIVATVSALNNLSAAQVNSEVDTALADINLDHLVKIAVDADFATTVHLNSVVGQMADNGTAATFDRTTDALEAIRDRGDAAWTTGTALDAAGVRGAVGLASANLDTQLDALPTNAELATALGTADDAVLAQVALVKAKTDSLTFSTTNRVDAQVFGMEAGTVTGAAIATDAIDGDAIAASAVTEIQSGLSTIDAAAIRSAVGLASANLDTQLTTIDDFLDTEVAAIKAKTDNLPSDPADASDIAGAFSTVNSTLATIAAYVDTEVGAIKTVTDKLSPTASAIGRGTVTTGASTTSVPTSAFTPAGAVADQFKGRVLLFDATTTTTTLRGTAVEITASSNAATPTFTVGTLPATPQSGDTFSVI